MIEHRHTLSMKRGKRTPHSNKQLSQENESLAFHLVVVGILYKLDKYYLLLPFTGKYGTLFVSGKVDHFFYNT